MATFFALPKLGMNQEDAEILSWLISEGDEVVAGQPIVEVETDKASVELEAPTSGVVAQILHREGDIVPINGVLAVIVAPGEELPTDIPETVA
jgi:pyruvate dehydrogenase E2 component (dihydrolipoamide acetyltransferase)